MTDWYPPQFKTMLRMYLVQIIAVMVVGLMFVLVFPEFRVVRWLVLIFIWSAGYWWSYATALMLGDQDHDRRT